jgi:nucleoside-diphosphate-sugar epimerase
MRILVAGATGVIGRSLLPRLLARGHEVAALVRRPAPSLPDGVQPLVADALDAQAVRSAVATARPEAIVHQLSALRGDPAEALRTTAVLRRAGTAHLVEAAVAEGVRRLVVQSIAFATAPVGADVLDEAAPLHLQAPDPLWADTVQAVQELEERVTTARDVSAVVLRYGILYGAGTLYARTGRIPLLLRTGRYPLVDPGTGITSFLHVDDAASAAVVAVEGAVEGIHNVVDDDPAPAGQWLPHLAKTVGGPEPATVTAEESVGTIGWFPTYQQTQLRGASAEAFRAASGWRPDRPSWRTGLGV